MVFPVSRLVCAYKKNAVRSLALAVVVAPLSVLAQGGAPPPPPVSVAKPIKREVVNRDDYTGRFEAVKSVEIRARVSGYLETINFTDGQYVKKGDLLYVIDPRPYEAVVARAKASVARAESQVALRKVEVQRGERLLKSKTISQDVVDTRRANLKVAEADRASARADLRTAELNLAYTRLSAPLSGQISKTEKNVGSLISGGAGGSTLLTTLVSTDPIYFTFDVNESDYLKYRRLKDNGGRPSPDNPLEPVFVKLLGEKTWDRKGSLQFVDNVFDKTSGTLRVRAIFPNPSQLLLPGVFGRIRVPSGKPYEALLIAPKAVLADQAMKLVMTVKEDGTVAPRPVELGPVIDGLQVVKSGLTEKDRIIVSGLLRARPGAKVTPQEVPMGGSAP